MSIIQKTATEQLALLNSGELTSVELTQAYLNQIEQVVLFFICFFLFQKGSDLNSF